MNGTKYQGVDATTGNIKIVILQRGWVMVGRLERTGDDCTLHDASVVREWGTTHGLGQIAIHGPTRETILDKCGLVEFSYLTTIATIACVEDRWASSL